MGPAPLVLLAAALTGLASLAAEMLWVRGVARSVGTPYEAVAAVAGLFLAGIGTGALLAARRAPHAARPARSAALLLVGAGAGCVLSPLYVAALPDLHGALADLLGSPLGGPGPALLATAPLVLPVALLLGAVFPYLVRARVQDVAHAGARSGGVYAANTVGAVLGVVAVPFALLAVGEALGLRLAGAGAWAAALALLLADRPLPHGEGPPAQGVPGVVPSAGGLGPALFVSGAAALMAQMAWLRMLQPLAGAHILGLALLLAPLLSALALGAALAGPLADRLRRPALLPPLLLAAAGALTLLSLPLAGGAPLRVVTARAPIAALALSFLLAVGPATLFFGALLPAAIRVRAAWMGAPSRPAGALLGWNALGALAGSLLAGFVLLPRMGAERALLLSAALAIAAAVLLRWGVGGAGRRWAAPLHALPLLVLAVPGVLGGWLQSGPGSIEMLAAVRPLPPGLRLRDREDLELYATWFVGRRATRPGDARGGLQPLFEGRGGRLVLVEEADGRIGLRRAGLRESLFDADRPERPALTELALGLLPALMHPDPQRALVIGHGAGWTAEALRAAGARDVDVAELDPSVLQAARAARGRARLPMETDAHARVLPVDGRALLRRAAAAGAARYDVIASQPSHPWHPASGHLFTRAAFASAREALAADGVLAQWLNLFDMTPELLQGALASFTTVFEHAWVFAFEDELVLLGFRSAPHLAVERWEAFFAAGNAAAEGARAAGLEQPGHLWKHLLLDDAGLRGVVPAATDVLEDDRPRLELGLAWRRLRRAPPEDVFTGLAKGFPPDLESLLPDVAVRERWIADAVDAWRRAGANARLRLWTERLRWGTSLESTATRAEAALALGESERALTLLEAALGRAPTRGEFAALWMRAARQLIQVDISRGTDARRRTYAQLLERFPRDGRVLAAAALLQQTLGRLDDARALYERALAVDEPPAGVGVRYARLLLSGAFSPEDEARTRALLAGDPETYTDVDALDMLLRTVGAAGDETRAAELEATLATLQRARGLAAFRAAQGHLARHEFGRALDSIDACTLVWGEQAAPFELRGLVNLALAAAWPFEGIPPPATEEALVGLQGSIERSDDPAQARARARRILGWYGLDPALVDPPAPTED